MRNGAGWALFLDFDGTLVEIAERPEAVVVEPGLTDTLAALRHRLRGALAIVSGRAIATLDGVLAPVPFGPARPPGGRRRDGMGWSSGSAASCSRAGRSPIRPCAKRSKSCRAAFPGIPAS